MVGQNKVVEPSSAQGIAPPHQHFHNIMQPPWQAPESARQSATVPGSAQGPQHPLSIQQIQAQQPRPQQNQPRQQHQQQHQQQQQQL
mmetsp:Transcript_10351/g.17764  ORF Transcript_10351/g.17764 Transcript_10351/m.17764 type:complete len:87 (+) Transcript_10351:348-608(+)